MFYDELLDGNLDMEEQKIYIDKCINATRYIYNWALEQEYAQKQLS